MPVKQPSAGRWRVSVAAAVLVLPAGSLVAVTGGSSVASARPSGAGPASGAGPSTAQVRDLAKGRSAAARRAPTVLPTGTIAGTVRAAFGAAGLSRVVVDVYAGGRLAGSASTQPGGAYRVPGLPPAAGYRVCFDASRAQGGSSTAGYFDQCYSRVGWDGSTGGAVGSTPVLVRAAVTTPGIDAALVSAGAIAGTVTAAGTAAPLKGVTVVVYDSSGNLVTNPSPRTAADGSYRVTGLPASTSGYQVCFDPSTASGGGSATGYVDQCFRDVPWDPAYSYTPYPPRAVVVLAGQTVAGIDVAVRTAGAITGRVTAAGSGTGLGGVAVDLFYSDSFDGPSLVVTTRPDGTYRLAGLPPSSGSDTVCFDASKAGGGWSTTGFVDQCFENAVWDPAPTGQSRPRGARRRPLPAPGSAVVPVTVRSGVTTTGVDAGLVQAAAVAGRVTSTGGAGVGGVGVYVYQNGNYFPSFTAVTAPDGSYLVRGVTPSVPGHTVCFDASTASGPSAAGYLDQCYRAVPWDGSTSPSGAAPVAVSAGATTTGVDATLAAGGGMTGRVTAAVGGAGLAGVVVSVFDTAGNYVTQTTSGTDGRYAVAGLLPSAAGYVVCFDPYAATGAGSATGYLAECYRDVPWSSYSLPTGTTPVVVPAGKTVTVSQALPAASVITGRVTAALGGAGLAGVALDVFDSSGAPVGVFVQTVANGTYVLPGLPPSSTGYTVCFDASQATGGSSTTGYADQCYDGVTWDVTSPYVPPAGTTPVVLAAGETVAGIDASLQADGQVAGTVMAADGGGGLAGVGVTAFDSAGTQVTIGGTSTGADGSYLLTGLAPSVVGYTICFDGSQATGGPSGSGYLDLCYLDVPWDGSTSPVGGRPVQVAAAATTTGVDVALPSAGGVSGTVTGTGGAGVPGVYVDVFDGSATMVRSVPTGADGTYLAPGLPLSAAGFTVCFDAAYVTGPAPATGYADQCYQGVAWSGPRGPLPAGTSSVAVRGGAPSTGVDARLTAAGALSGTVTSAVGGAGLQVVVVDVYDGAGHQLAYGFTAQDGSYTVVGLTPLAAGYTVCFDASGAIGGSSSTGYLSQCYRDVPWAGVPPVPAGVSAVPVQGGQTVTGVDASLAAG